MKPIVLIGYGSIGKRHFRNLKTVLGNDFPITVFDPYVEEKDHEHSHDTTFISNLEDLEANAYSCAFICTPNDVRFSVIEPLISKKIKYYFIEKPVASTIEEAQRIVELLETHKCHGFIGCNLRFHKAITVLKNAIDAQKIGKVLYTRSVFSHYLPNWRPDTDYRKSYSAIPEQGGGIALDAIHEPDYLTWLFGEADILSSLSLNTGLLDIRSEDIAAYFLKHETGVISEVFVDYLRADKLRKCEIIGEEGSIEWESRGKSPEKISIILYKAQESEILLSEKEYDANEQYIEEIRYFVHGVENNLKLMSSPKNGLATLQIIESVKQQ